MDANFVHGVLERAKSRKLHLEKGRLIDIFTPKGFTIDDSDRKLQKIAKVTVRFHTKQKILRLSLVILHGLILVIVVTFSKVDFHITKAIGAGLAALFFIYFFQVYYLVMYSNIPHRVYSLSGIIPNWTKMPITYRALIYKYTPIQSISEFSAIGGGMSNQLLLVLSTTAWISLLTQILNNIWFEKLWLQFTHDLVCNGCNKTNVNLFGQVTVGGGIDQVVMLIGTFGLVLIGIFELDPFSKILQNGHMLGVFLGFCCPIGFSIQQLIAFLYDGGFYDHPFGIIFAIVFDVVAVVFALIWICYFNRKSEKLATHLHANPPETEYDENIALKQVRYLTVMNIFTESITLLCGSLALCLWLWNFNDLYPSFKKIPGVLPNGGPWRFFFDYIVKKYDCDLLFRPPVANPSVSYCTVSPTQNR